jgi:hypothetical protein
MNSQSKPLLFRYDQELTAVALGEPCLVLIDRKDPISLLLAQSACEESYASRLVLVDVTHLRAGRDEGSCRTMAEVAIYESGGRWVAEDTASHEILPQPAPHPYAVIFISKEP